MMSTIFSKIIEGEIPSYKVYETDHVLAFLDINPCSPGHTVVIPKEPVAVLQDLSAESAATLLPAVQEVMKKIDAVLSPDGYNVGWNHGEAGGQAIQHLHIHVIPRWNGDGGKNMHAIVSHDDGRSVEEIAQLFS